MQMMAQHRFPNYLELRPNLVWCWYIWWFHKVTRLLSYTGCFHSSTFTFSSNIENLALYLCLICLPYLNTIWNSCKLNAMIIRAWNGWTPVALTIEYCGRLNTLMSQHKLNVYKKLVPIKAKFVGRSILAHSALFSADLPYCWPKCP